MLQGLTAIQSLLLVQNKELADEVFALVRDMIELTMVEMEAGFFDLAEHFGRVRTLEWKITANKGVEKDTKRPDVSFLTVGAFHDFGSHVVGSTGDCLELPLALGCLGQTKVDKTHGIVCRYHDVVRLDIAMDDVLRVTVIDRLEQTLHVPSCGRLSESLISLLGDLLEELRSRHVLHNQVDILSIIVSLVILDNIRVIERVQYGNFLHDAVNIIPQLNLVKHFNRDLEIRVVNVRSMEHTTEGSDTEHLGV